MADKSFYRSSSGSSGSGHSSSSLKSERGHSSGSGRKDKSFNISFNEGSDLVHSDDYFSNGYQPKYISGTLGPAGSKTVSSPLYATGLKVANTAFAGSKNMAGSSMDEQNVWADNAGNFYIWVGNDGQKNKNNSYGYYLQLSANDMISLTNGLYPGSAAQQFMQDVMGDRAPKNKMSIDFSKVDSGYYSGSTYMTQNTLADLLKKSEEPEKDHASTTGSSSANSPTSSPNVQDPLIDRLMNRINELEDAMKPRVIPAEEMAAQYDIADKYNIKYWEDLYNEATNNYYDAAVNEQEKLRTDYAYNNALYTDDIIKDYLKSYQNAAPTAASRGAMAANALSADAIQGSINANNDQGMLGSVNQLEQDRLAELAKNPSEALTTYQNLGSYLMNLSSDHNKADVTNYVNELSNLATRYAADRTVSQANAQAAASKYSGLANAAQTNAQTAANNFANTYQQQLYDMYKNYTNRNDTAYLNSLGIKN